MNYNEINDKLFDFERKHGLIKWSVSGVKIYQIIRWLIYSDLIFYYTNFKPKTSPSSMSKLTGVIYRIYNSIFSNPFIDMHKTDIIIFESDRFFLFNGEYIDSLTFHIQDELQKNKTQFTSYRYNSVINKKVKRGSHVRHLDFILLISKYLSLLIKIKLSTDEIVFIKKIEKEYHSIFGFKFDLVNLIVKEIANFKCQYFFYRNLFKVKKPKQIFIYSYIGKAAMIHAAKKRKTEVVEIQHGFYSNDLINSYPDTKADELDYFSDKMYIWGKEWISSCKIPLKSNCIVEIKNRFLLTQIEKFKEIVRKTNVIVIISQWTVTDEIANFVDRAIGYLGDYMIYYKLHPFELDRIEEFPVLMNLGRKENVEIIKIEKSVYELLSMAQFVISVNSTVGLEAIEFGCKLILLDLFGVESMSFLVDSGKATFVKNELELAKYLKIKM